MFCCSRSSRPWSISLFPVKPQSASNDENAFDASLVVMTPTGDVIQSRIFEGPGPSCITGMTTAGFSKPFVGYSSGGAAGINLDGYFGWFDYR